MSFSLNTNITSLQAQTNLRASSDFQSKTINRVTSGLRIVNSGDDAAGLAIANAFRSDQAVLTQGIRNANDGLSTLQTIDGGMNNISMLLDRARTLATQSASGTLSGGASARALLNNEFQSVMAEIDRQSQAIGLNQNGDFAKSLSVFIGGGKGASASGAISNGSVSVDLSNSKVDTTNLGLNSFRAANSGYDIGANSSTSVTTILQNVANTASEPGAAGAGKVRFNFVGAGFSAAPINVDVNVAGVKDTDSLVTAINTAIQSAANPSTPSAAATAFKNAGVTASIITDSNGRQQVAFSAPHSAFQVQAGDLTANALLGNLQGTNGTGATLKTSNTGGAVAATASIGAAEQFILNGKALSFTLSTGTGTVANRVTDFNTAIAAAGTDLAIKDKFTAVADGSKIRIENNNGDSFTIEGNATTKADYGLSGSSTVTSYAVTGSAMTPASLTAHNYSFDTTVNAATASATGNDVVTITDATNGTQTFTYATVAATTTAAAQVVLLNATTNFTASGYTASLVGGKLHIVNSDTTLAFSVSGDAAAQADLKVAGAPAAAADAGNLPTGGAAGGAGTVTIVDAAGTHTLNLTTVAYDDTGAMVTNLQGLIDADTGSAGAAGKYTVSQDSSHNLIITATDTTATFTVASTGTGTSDLKLAAGPTTSTGTSVATSALATSTQTNSVDSGGAQISSQYGDTKAYAWTALTGSQDITISGSHADGTQFNWTTTLDSGNASSLNNVIGQLNTALQGSSDSSLTKIIAVKDGDSGNALGIRFMSSDAFSVKLGATTVPGQGLKDGSTGAVANGQGAVLLSDTSLGAGAVDISNQTAAQSAVSALATAVTTLGTAQAVVGKGENTFNYAMNLAQSQSTNLAAAESRIRDADLASEAANLTKAQILIQAGTAALAQANSAPQAILALLK